MGGIIVDNLLLIHSSQCETESSLSTVIQRVGKPMANRFGGVNTGSIRSPVTF